MILKHTNIPYPTDYEISCFESGMSIIAAPNSSYSIVNISFQKAGERGSPGCLFVIDKTGNVWAVYYFDDYGKYTGNTWCDYDTGKLLSSTVFTIEEIGAYVYSPSYCSKISDDFHFGCYLNSTNTIKLNIKHKYSDADFLVIPNLQTKTVRSNGSVKPDSGYSGLGEVIVDTPNENNLRLQNLEVTPTRSIQTFTPPKEFHGFGDVTVNAIPDSLVEPKYQEKTVTPTNQLQQVTYDESEGYNALLNVFVNPVPTQDTPTFTENGTYTPNEGEFFDEVNVNVFQLDTSDATATESEIFKDKTAYINGEKKTGTFTIDEELTEQNDLLEDIEALLKTKLAPLEITGTIEITKNGTHNVKNYEFADVNVQPLLQDKTVTENATVTADEGFDGLNSVTVNVQPLLQEKETSASETQQDIVADDGFYGLSKVSIAPATLGTKAVSPSTTAQTITPDSGDYGLKEVNISAVTADIDENIVPTNIVKGVSILGVEGEYEPLLEDKTVTPTIESQTITPSEGYDGLSSVTLEEITLQDKTVSPRESTQTITADEGALALGTVTVNSAPLQAKTVTPVTGNGVYVYADNDYYGLRNVYVEPIEIDRTNNTITENGTFTPTEGSYFNSVTVDVQPALQDKTVLPLEEIQTITADDGYDGLSQVKVEAMNLEEAFVFPSTTSQTKKPSKGYDGLKQVTISAIQTETATITKNGTYTPTSGKYYNSVTVSVEGGGSIEGKQKITVIDYDGTILEETYVAEGDTYTLPDSSYVEGLVFQKWACPIEIVDNQIIVEDYPVTIAPIYYTAYTKITVELTKATGLTVNLKNITIGYLTWGDGASSGGGTSFSHTYSTYGTYTIEILSGGTTFGEYVFGQTSSAHNFYVKSISLSNKVTSIGNYAFRYCESLETLTIPNTVTSIGLYACEYCYNLKTAIIPASVQNLYSYAFQYTWGGLKYAVLDYGITSISNYVFNYATNIKELIIPDTATVGNYVVGNCSSLETIKLPTGYSSSSSDTPFSSNLYALKTIILKNATMTTLGGSFLNGAYSLEKFDIPSSVTTINYSAFSNCYALEKLVIPSGVTNINSSTFYNCKSLKRIDFSKHTSVPTLTSSTEFNTANKLLKIVVPNGLKNEWIAATNWSNFANYIYSVREAGIL